MEDDIYSFQITNSIGEKINIKIAPLILRIQSYFIDLFILLQVQILFGILYWRFYKDFYDNINFFYGGMNSGLMVYYLCHLTIYVLYFLLQEYFFYGQTIGKRLLRLKVISVNGGISPFKDLLLRNVIRVIEVGYFPLIGGLVSFFHAENKRWGDILGACYVVFEEPEARHYGSNAQ